MPRVAIEFRPSTIGALLLTGGLALGLQCMSRGTCVGHRRAAVIEVKSPVVGSLGTPWVAPHGAAIGRLIDPGDHPDARPWPHGMVVAPPPTPDPMNLLFPRVLPEVVPTVVDTVLSALLGPASVVAS